MPFIIAPLVAAGLSSVAPTLGAAAIGTISQLIGGVIGTASMAAMQVLPAAPKTPA